MASLAASRQFTFKGTALRRWWDSPSSPAGRTTPRCHSERSEESLPRPSRFPPRGIAAVVGTKNMPPACFLNVPTQAVVGFTIAHVSAETCLSALRADAISRGQQRVSPLMTPSCLNRPRRGGALLRPSLPPLSKGTPGWLLLPLRGNSPSRGPPSGGGGIHPRRPQGVPPPVVILSAAKNLSPVPRGSLLAA